MSVDQFLTTLAQQSLNGAEVPLACRGVEGLRVAQDILVRTDSIGLVIGGLGTKLSYGSTTALDLRDSKDVDVVVLEGEEATVLAENARIDWFFKRQREGIPLHFGNVKQAVLYFRLGIKAASTPLASGLYAPRLSLLKEILKIEDSPLYSQDQQGLGSNRKLRELNQFGVNDTFLLNQLLESRILVGSLGLEELELEALPLREVEQVVQN